MSTVLDVIKEEIATEVARRKDALASGSVADYPAYRELVGVIRGLESCYRYITDLAHNLEGNDND